MLIAHITDAHLLSPDDNRAEYASRLPSAEWSRWRLEAALNEIASLDVQPDLLIFGGDMTNSRARSECEWRIFFEVLRGVKIPFLITLGNHEHEFAQNCPSYNIARNILRAHHVNPGAMDDYWCYATDIAGYQLVVLDSLETGDLGTPQHEFLKAALRRRVPTLISCHRPIVMVGNEADPVRLIDETYVKLLSEAESLIAVISGHTHKSCATNCNGVLHLISPSVSFGMGDGTGYRLLCLTEGRIAWTAVRRVPGPSSPHYLGEIVEQQGSLECIEYALD